MRYIVSGKGPDQDNIRIYENDSVIWTASCPGTGWACFTGDLMFTTADVNQTAAVISWKKEGNGYRQVDTLLTKGFGLCHLDCDESLLAGASWGNGYFFTASFTPDGHFMEMTHEEIQSDGTPKQSRCHCVKVADEYVYAVNIELDMIFVYQRDGHEVEECGHIRFPFGSGPRHMHINEEKQLMYVVTEYSNRLYTLDISDPVRIKILNSLSCLPLEFAGADTGCTLAVTQNYTDLYTANRGLNTIAHFKLDKYGMPVPWNRFAAMGFNRTVLEQGTSSQPVSFLENSVQPVLYSGEQPKLSVPTALFTSPDQISVHGITPRHITLLDQDRILGIVNQDSDNCIFLQRDPETGDLSASSQFELSFKVPTFIREL